MRLLSSLTIYACIFCNASTTGFLLSPGVVVRNHKDLLQPRSQSELRNVKGDSSTDSEKSSEIQDNNREQEEEGIQNKSLLRLAELSLEDYEWRQSLFKTNEADRKVEESLARMMGEEASYVRPMDASVEKIGPLGLLEKSSVDWLSNVIEEEARRAKRIVLMGGMMVRPIDAVSSDGELGPLGLVEKRVVDFLENIRSSERERSRTRTLRPKDLDPSQRGVLGEAEQKAVEKIKEILESEKLRAQQSKIRDQVVRPIDVPGPLGNFEMKVLEVVKAEKERALEKEEMPDSLFLRPKDSKVKGPLGELEEQAVEAVNRLTNEEKYRLRNLQRLLEEKRPMEQDQSSLLGMFETVAVGIFRAPILLFQLFARVKELLQSESLAEEDAEILRRRERIKAAKRKKTDS